MKKGDCFVVAFGLLEKLYSQGLNPVLVHGVVTGEGGLDGVEYSHAWVEIGDENDVSRTVVLDDTVEKGFSMLATEYYKQGKIKITKKYSYLEGLKQIVNNQHWGPWDKVFDDYQ